METGKVEAGVMLNKPPSKPGSAKKASIEISNDNVSGSMRSSKRSNYFTQLQMKEVSPQALDKF